MKIAISNDKDFVAEHFGKCEKYTFFEIENKKIIKKEEKNCPNHDIGIIPKFLKENKVNVVLTQGIGPRAIKILKNNEIKVILVKKNSIQNTIENYLKNELEKKDNDCNHLKSKKDRFKKI